MRPRKPLPPLDSDALYNYAVRLLGQQMRTVAELKRLLRRRLPPDESGQAGKGSAAEAQLDGVVARLKDRRYLDDTGYAQDYTRLRQEDSAFGRRRVQQDLIRKGVHSQVIATTLDAAYENVSEEDLARRHLARKRVSQPTSEKDAARVMRLLVRAGFGAQVIFRILRQWNLPDETLAALESAEIAPEPEAEG